MSKQKPSFWAFLGVGLALCVLGWAGLYFLIINSLPYLGPRWLFFFILTLALTGTGLPVTYFLNLRFRTDPPADSGVVLREAMWFGVYGSLLAWFQLGRVLTSGLAVVLFVGLVLVEYLLRLGERSTWSPARNLPLHEDVPVEEDEDEEEDG